MIRLTRFLAVLLVPLGVAGCWQVVSMVHHADQADQWTAGDPEQTKNAGGFNRFQIDENIELLRPAADKGDAEAQFRLGTILELYSFEAEEGVRLLTVAANQNYVPAQYQLGRYYAAKGLIMAARDEVKAYMWYQIAASRGHRCVDRFRGNYAWAWLKLPPLTVPIYEQPMHAKYERVPCAAMERDDTAGEMTPGQIAEARRLAGAWAPASPARR